MLMPPMFLLHIQGTVLWIPAISLLAFSYGAITLFRAAFQRTSDQRGREDTGPNSTSLTALAASSVCPVPLSLAVTHGIAIAFSSSAY
jgi:hypothetical protein